MARAAATDNFLRELMVVISGLGWGRVGASLKDLISTQGPIGFISFRPNFSGETRRTESGKPRPAFADYLSRHQLERWLRIAQLCEHQRREVWELRDGYVACGRRGRDHRLRQQQ